MTNHNDAEFLKYYVRELEYLRKMGAEFQAQYPLLATRLDIGDADSTDPHVERLLESFAYLAGRLQYNIDSEFPEIPSAIFDLLYPHLQVPIPSLMIARFDVDPKRGKLTSGFDIPRHTSMFTKAQDGLTCRFRSCYPVTLWPLKVTAARLQQHGRLGPMLWLRLKSEGVKVKELTLQSLRFHIAGREPLVGTLYEMLFAQAEEVHVVPATDNAAVHFNEMSRLPDDQAIKPVGFGPEENLFPTHPSSHMGYRLLQEYFAFPKKYHFFDIGGINLAKLGALFSLPETAVHCLQAGHCISDNLRAMINQQNRALGRDHVLCQNTTIAADPSQPDRWTVLEGKNSVYEIRRIDHALFVFPFGIDDGDTFDIWIRFNRESAVIDLDYLNSIGMMVNSDNFQLGCTPVINLFDKTSEPIRLDHTQVEYPLVGDYHFRNTTEIHTIKEVMSVSEWGREKREISPYYSLKHTQLRRNQKSYWRSRRILSPYKGLPGTEVYLSFVNLDYQPNIPDAQTVYAKTLCTNRHLAEQLPISPKLQIEISAPVLQVVGLDKPTPQIDPPLQGETLWRLVSQLSLNHLSLDETIHFRTAHKYSQDLANQIFSDGLRQEFAQQGLFVSDDMAVVDQSEINTWILRDRTTSKSYLAVADDDSLSISTGHLGLAALQEILRLYVTGESNTSINQIMGIDKMYVRRVVGRSSAHVWANYCRGLEITLLMDEDKYINRGAFLLASVLNQFFRLHVSMNTFTQLKLRSKQREGEWHQWPRMAGQLSIL